MKSVYGLIGRRLGHSYSADFFNHKFGVEHIDAEYRLMPLPDISDLPALLDSIPALEGFNVTVPYKEAVIPYLDSLSELAAGIGAVNVVKVMRSAHGLTLHGFNSDAYGFRESLLPLLPDGARKALVLGTGGASKAVAFVLCRLGLEVTKVSRTPLQEAGVTGYDSLTPDLIGEYDVIVNTTPLGMWPDVDACPPIPYDGVRAGMLCYDVVYNPEQTLFMRLCRERGAAVSNGLEMLKLQALRAWEIWSSPHSM